MLNTLENLFSLARDRKKSPKEGSYTNKLLNDKSLSKAKVLEEINGKSLHMGEEIIVVLIP